MKKYKKITEQEFNNIKQLTGLISTSKVAEITKRSRATISNIKRAETVQEYRELVRAYGENKKTADIFPLDSDLSTVVPNELSGVTADAVSDIDRIVAALGAINTSILKLVDAWEAKSEKKGWLK